MKISKEQLHPWLNVMIAGALLGLSIRNNYFILGTLSIAALYFNEKKLLSGSWMEYMSATFISTQLLFLTTTWWFTNITAEGWNQSIGILTPQQWLGGMLLLASFLTSLLALIPRIVLKKYIAGNTNKQTIAVAWALTIVCIELVLSLSMAQITRGHGVPLVPSWNFWSGALLLPSFQAVIFIKSTFGFWGSSFILIILVAVIVDTVQQVVARQKKNHIFKIYTPLLTLVLVLLVIILFSKSTLHRLRVPNESVQVVAISADAASNSYLDIVTNEVRNDGKTIIVLPEYSSLLNPYPAGILSIKNKDYTGQIKQNITANTVIVGTEDYYSNGKRYVASYILDRQLNTIRTRQKQFLVPGGEYVTPWISNFVSLFDKNSVQKFSKDRGRYVMSKNVEIHNSSTQIGLGACSTVLTPYAYRQEVDQGARILTSSISFEQFKKTSQYEKYAQRFAVFNAQSLQTPLVISAFNGEALIINSNGRAINRSRNGVIRSTVNLRTEMTLYGRLGDRTILLLLFSICGIFLVLRRRTKL